MPEENDHLCAEIYPVPELGIVRVVYYRNGVAALMLQLDPDSALEMANEQRRIALSLKKTEARAH